MFLSCCCTTDCEMLTDMAARSGRRSMSFLMSHPPCQLESSTLVYIAFFLYTDPETSSFSGLLKARVDHHAGSSLAKLDEN